MDNSAKYIVGTLMLLLAVGIYFGGSKINVGGTMCSSNWSVINPLCWGTSVINFVAGLFFTLLAIWTAIFAMLIFAMPVDKTGWIIGLYIFLTLFVVDLFLPDPIPFGDEILLFLLSSVFGIKTLGASAPKAVQNIF